MIRWWETWCESSSSSDRSASTGQIVPNRRHGPIQGIQHLAADLPTGLRFLGQTGRLQSTGKFGQRSGPQRHGHGEYLAKALIIAAGVSRVRPGIEGIAAYEGKGVSYCVSCDGFFYRGRPVVVVGEGNYAANQALELTNFTKDITIYTQGKTPEMGNHFADRLREAGITVSTAKLERLLGDPALSGARLADGSTIACDGLFVAMGQASAMDFAKTLGVTAKGAFLEADHDQQTNIPGVFAAGDCVGHFLQISVAVGEGAKAGRGAIAYIKSRLAR